MRIAFYAPRASYLGPGLSGDSMFLRRLLTRLRERGSQVEIVSRVNVRDFWRGRLPARRIAGEALSIVRRLREFSPDAWLVYGTSVKNPDLFGWWQRPRRYVLLNTDAGDASPLPPRWKRLFALAHRRSLARADRITAERPKNAAGLRRLGVPEERLSVSPPAVETWDRMPSQKEARERLGLPPDVPVLLCASRFTAPRADGRPWKTESILELLNALPPVPFPPGTTFVLVGDGPGRPRVEEKIAELGLSRLVTLAGPVPPDDMKWYYSACDFFAYRPVSDRMYNTILEAQACGRPVVMPRTESARLMVAEGSTGLLAKDLDEFRLHLATLAGDRARCRSMGEAARDYVREHHSIETRARQIEMLLTGEGPRR